MFILSVVRVLNARSASPRLVRVRRPVSPCAFLCPCISERDNFQETQVPQSSFCSQGSQYCGDSAAFNTPISIKMSAT